MDPTTFDPQTTLRILCGVWFAPHCIGKLRNIGPASQTFEKAGLRPGRVVLFITVALELLAGIGLVTGILAEAAALLAVLVLGGASYAVLRINGVNWRWQRQGPEYMVFWAVACLLSVVPW
jgi:putative oxidoreductase